MSSVQEIMVDERSPGAAGWACAPFDPALADEAQRLIGRLDAAQRLWLSGYLAGGLGAPAPLATSATASQPLVTVLVGSHSGNGEKIARRIDEALAQRALSFITLDMLDCRKQHLQEARHLLVVVSTHGEGDPPERALPLYELLHGRKAPKLAHLKYSVLALGDSSYEKFCETGRRFDAQLEALGAQRLHARVECDVDFQAASEQWIEAVVDQLAREHASAAPAPARSASRVGASIAAAYTRKYPFHAPVLTNRRLTARDSSKDVRHLELSIEGAGIHYEPGDALGIVPRNRASDVDALLEALPVDADASVSVNGQDTPLREALMSHLDIGLLTRSLIERYCAATNARALADLLAAGCEADLNRFIHGRHLIDLLIEHPPLALDAAGLAQILRPLAPRLYSIASSPRATPDEIHLTVSVVGYESHGRVRCGVISGGLADWTADQTQVPVYPHRNPAFRLPSSHHAPIIMIGPGTGVAPFRAFVAEREALGARGRNWLFFGDRCFRSDFLYQTEWLEWRKRGVLERIDVAFSRDGAGKVYVQNRMREHGRELFAWLESGAYIYVCGDAQSMAPDVDRALREIIQRHGALSVEQADEYVLNLQRDRRYQKDVY